MSILSALFGNYGDDLIRNAATKYGDDVLRSGAKTAAKQTILNQADDIAGMTAKQAAKATAKAGKSTVNLGALKDKTTPLAQRNQGV